MSKNLDRCVVFLGLFSLTIIPIFPDYAHILRCISCGAFGWCLSLCREVQRKKKNIEDLERYNLYLRERLLSTSEYSHGDFKCK